MNKADRDLFLFGLSTGDLVQLHADPHRINPEDELTSKVVVGYGYEEDEHYGWLSRGWYFKYIDSGTLAIYICRLPQGATNNYWASFHKIHCEGAICIVHEKFLYRDNWEYDPNNIPERTKSLYGAWISGSSGSR